MRIVVAGGGTAGHVTPALALAEALEGHSISFVGTSEGAEATLVPEAGYPLDRISVVGFDRSKPLAAPAVAARAGRAVARARQLLKTIKPDVVVGMGGYVSLPMSIAAGTRRVPLVLHEQNIVFGLAHRISKRFATRIAVSFEETLGQAGKKGVWTGNPVRSDLVHADVAAARVRALEAFGLKPNRKTLLVFGGSLGAQTVTEAALGLGGLWAKRTDVQVLHILGRRGGEVAVPRSAGLVYRTVPYVERMVEAYAVADLAVCRGGASTVAELTVMGLPAIIVPYPHHRDRQQERHAEVLAAAGAARTLPDAEATAETLADTAEVLLSDDAARASMAAASRLLGKPDAAQQLAEIVLTVGS